MLRLPRRATLGLARALVVAGRRQRALGARRGRADDVPIGQLWPRGNLLARSWDVSRNGASLECRRRIPEVPFRAYRTRPHNVHQRARLTPCGSATLRASEMPSSAYRSTVLRSRADLAQWPSVV